MICALGKIIIPDRMSTFAAIVLAALAFLAALGFASYTHIRKRGRGQS
jgi:hypothetical protein